MKCRDCSNYTDDNIEALMAQWYAEGDRLVIIQAFPPTYPQHREQRRQIAAAEAVGMQWDAYIYDYLASPDWRDAALGWLTGRTQRMVWLDEEDTTPSGVPARVAAISRSIDAVEQAGHRVGVYTAAWWWGPNTGNTNAFASYPLWAAQYDGIPDASAFTPFGGWTSCAIKQYAGSQPDGTDLNVLSDALVAELTAEPPAEEPIVRIPQDYVDKFSLSSDQDIDGLIANFEGVIRTVKEIEARKDEDAENRLAQIKALVNA